MNKIKNKTPELQKKKPFEGRTDIFIDGKNK